MTVKKNFAPMLYGQMLTQQDGRFFLPTGEAIAEKHVADVVFVRTAEESDISSELAGLLSHMHLPSQDIEFDAGFFHTSLSQWMNMEPGTAADAPIWDYDFWKAEIVHGGEHNGADCYAAHIYRGDGNNAETYRYFVEFSDGGQILRSGWLSAPPNLLDDDESTFRDEEHARQVAAATLLADSLGDELGVDGDM